MLRIGRKGNDVQVKPNLDDGYEDITSVMMWVGVVEKYGFDASEAAKQIDLYVRAQGGADQLNEHDQCGMGVFRQQEEKKDDDYDFV